MNIKNDKKMQSIVVFSISILFIVIYNLISLGSLYASSPDGDLYISIADNFISTGHFSQTARPSSIDMVVPPGLPFIILIFKTIFININGLLIFQYILFGLLNVFLYNTCLKLYKSKTFGSLAVIMYCTSSLVLKDVASPKYILTETYTQCIIACVLYIISLRDIDLDRKIKYILPLIVIGFFIRTVFSIWLIIIAIITIIRVVQKKINWEYALKVCLITVIFLLGNMLINYRETGELVLLQNYGGNPIYQANNPNTKTDTYSSGLAREFVEQDFFEITESNMTTSQKSKILNSRAKKWMFENFGTFVQNTIIKFYKMFVKSYNLDFYIMIFFVVYMIVKHKKIEPLIYFIMFLPMAITTSMGLNISRYTCFALIIYIVMKVGFLNEIYKNLKKLL